MPGANLGWPQADPEPDSASAVTELSALSDSQTLPAAAASVAPPPPRIVNYPYPLRPGLLISVSLPADMTAQEADRFAAFVRSLAVAAEPAGESSTS